MQGSGLSVLVGLAQDAVNALQSYLSDQAGTLAAPPGVDLVVGTHGYPHQLVIDADRVGHEMLARNLTGVGAAALTGPAAHHRIAFSHTSELTWISDPQHLLDGAIVALAVGQPRRAPTIKTGTDGQERLVFRTIATLTATHDERVPAHVVAALLHAMSAKAT